MSADQEDKNAKLSRRLFLRNAGLAGAGLTTVPILASAPAALLTTSAAAAPGEAAFVPDGAVSVRFVVNGVKQTLRVDPRATLLDTLRETLHLTGTKKGCDHGQCGACTVHINGQRANSCLALAVTLEGDQITTIEGLGKPDAMHPMQKAFVDNDAYQCGYCTPGQIMSAVAFLKEPCGKSDAAIRECMSGNICRCGAYKNILAAIKDVRDHA